jgi:hypothetical protein
MLSGAGRGEVFKMPVHDWTKVDSGIFHHFHHEWISEISRSLNEILHGTEYYALAEQITGGLGPDVLTLQRPMTGPQAPASGSKRRHGGVALAKSPPKLRFRISNPSLWYASKKKSVTIRHVSDHRVVAVLEIISPGNKSSRSAISAFISKAQELLSGGVHLAFVDLFPPTPRDPEGIHPLLFGEDPDHVFQFDPAKPLCCASYIGGVGAEAFVEPVAVGDRLPAIPLFLTSDEYVEVPLEKTYQAAFAAVPDVWQDALTPSKP